MRPEAEVNGLKKDMEALKSGGLTVDVGQTVQKAVDDAIEAKWPSLGAGGSAAHRRIQDPWAKKGGNK
eukprot:11441095-Karenia_brevis.AAC.1